MKLIIERQIHDYNGESEGKSQDENLAALIDLFYEDPPELFDGAKWRIIDDNQQIAVVRESSLAPQFSIDSDEYEEEEDDEDNYREAH